MRLFAIRLFLAGVLVCIGTADALAGGRISPPELTLSTVGATRTRLAKYYSANRRLPRSLAELPLPDKDQDSSTKDAWGRELGYSYTKESTIIIVTLWSLGKDGKLGGEGEEADLVEVFSLPRLESLGTTVVEGSEGRIVRYCYSIKEEVLGPGEVRRLLQTAITQQEIMKKDSQKQDATPAGGTDVKGDHQD